ARSSRRLRFSDCERGQKMVQGKRGLTRREFLKTTAAGVALGLAGAPSFLRAAEGTELAVISGEAAAATTRALEALGGISRFVKKGQRVVIKPNMSFARTPEFAATTHPLVVAVVAQACIDAGAQQVLVVDHTLHRPELCLERTGIREACRNIPGVHVLALQDRKFFREIGIPQGKVLEKVEVLKDVLDGSVLINIPVAKSHSTTGVSLGIKGLMGLIWDRNSFHYRFNINQGLADLATVIRPQLTILDATRAMATGGPGGPGEVKKPNLIIAGTDPVAVDAYGVSVVPWYGKNFKARQVEHLVVAHQCGLGKIDLDLLNIFKGTG
ncbi:MAG: DUF362 domain-containing protein, partial [Smithellaceae bacterium]|nr:DUF362 domain-containing protein [Smithellaceae bacterium]